MAKREDELSPERKEELLTNDRSFKIFVIDKLAHPYFCPQHKTLINNIRWIKWILGIVLVGLAGNVVIRSFI